MAILDIHIYRAGLLGGFFNDHMTIEKHYLDLESQFIALANSMGVKPSELDALMWYEMQESKSVHRLLALREERLEAPSNNRTTYNRSSNPHQLSLM